MSNTLTHKRPYRLDLIFLITNIVLVAVFPSTLLATEHLLLTGKVKAGVTQNFTAPWSPTWNQQIKWLKPEGELVEQGDLVVLFDTSGLDSQIEQQQSLLRQSKEKAKNSQLKLEKEIINAEHDLIKAQLELDFAKASVDIPKTYRSNLEEDNLNFDLKKAEESLDLAISKLETNQDSLKADTDKQLLEVKKIHAELTKTEEELEALQLRSNRSGAVLHASHPWNGSKITEGQSVQTSWKVASIPGSGSEYIQAWVNEVDWPYLKLNQKAILTLDAYPHDSFTGKVIAVGLQAEKKTEWGRSTYYDVKIQILKPSTNHLMPGMSVRIEFQKTRQSAANQSNEKENAS